jgi:hypothetical protein
MLAASWLFFLAGLLAGPSVNPLLNLSVLTLQDPMTIHCGFVGDPEAGLPGFHLDPQDSDALASCRIAVVSATFGASDAIHSISKSQARWKSRDAPFAFPIFITFSISFFLPADWLERKSDETLRVLCLIQRLRRLGVASFYALKLPFRCYIDPFSNGLYTSLQPVIRALEGSHKTDTNRGKNGLRADKKEQ